MTWIMRSGLATLGAALLLGVGATAACTAQLPVAAPPNNAFPGAQGFGRTSIGGRGGKIVPVTTLADAGPGSLRACIDAVGPRVCVFRVGGVIRFTTKRPIIRNPFLTIAGQTAPGGGILLTHAGGDLALTPLVIENAHDIIIRHLRIRTDRRGTIRGSNSAITIVNSRRVMIDHVSTSWSLDENVGGFRQNDEITIANSILAEGVPRHDKCALLSDDPTGPQRLSFVRNLCAHNGDRNPDINVRPGSCIEVLNNILYDGVVEFTEIWESRGGSSASVVGNYYRAGPSTSPAAHALVHQTVGSQVRARLFESGNVFDGVARGSPTLATILVAAPPCPLTFAPLEAHDAYARVLAGSGAFPLDAVDRRLVGEVAARTGAIVTGPGQLPPIANGTPYPDQDRDGMDDNWERANRADPTRFDAWTRVTGSQWTNLDRFLDARQHALGVPD